MSTREIFHTQLQWNFQKLFRCHRPEKIATWLYGALAKFADRKLKNCLNIKSFQFFCNFSGDVALPAQDMLHKEISTCDCNTIISWKLHCHRQ